VCVEEGEFKLCQLCGLNIIVNSPIFTLPCIVNFLLCMSAGVLCVC
jgi:hypothetical protein